MFGGYLKGFKLVSGSLSALAAATIVVSRDRFILLDAEKQDKIPNGGPAVQVQAKNDDDDIQNRAISINNSSLISDPSSGNPPVEASPIGPSPGNGEIRERRLRREVTKGTKLLEHNSSMNKLTNQMSPHTIGRAGGVDSSSNDANATMPRHTMRHSHYDYIIIGTGTAAQAACELLKHSDPKARLLIVTEYAHLSRPDVNEDEIALSHDIQAIFDRWRRPIASHLKAMTMDRDYDGIVNGERRTDVIVTQDFRGVNIDPENKLMSLSSHGAVVSYNKCLLAPPGKIRSHYVLDTTVQYAFRDFVNPLKNRLDFRMLQDKFTQFGEVVKRNEKGKTKRRKVAVLGGGFLGTEIASALSEINDALPADKKVDLYQLFFEDHPLDNILPKYLAKNISKRLSAAGVKILPNRLLTELTRDESATQEESQIKGAGVNARLVMMDNEYQDIELDYIVLASTRIDPDTSIAERSGLEVDRKNGGIIVNRTLEAYRDLFVAGNAASFFNPCHGRRRVFVYDHAINSGLVCARNMLNSGQDSSPTNMSHLKNRESMTSLSNSKIDTKLISYTHLPAYMCYLPRIGLKFECVGEVDSRLKTVGVWLARRDDISGQPEKKSDFQRGVVYYLKNSKVVGIVLCNAPECLEIARNVLNENLVIEDDAEKVLKRKIKLGPDHWLRVFSTK